MNRHETIYRPAQTIDGPWMQDPRWSSGRIGDQSRLALIVAWFFVLIWNGISWPLIVMLVNQELARQASIKPAAWVALIFPAIGLAGLIVVVYLTIRHFKFGRSSLELETLPGCIGGWFAGTIHAGVPLRDADGVRITLRCVRRVTRGTGKQRSTSESTLWQEEQTLVGRLPISRTGGSAIPVSFRVPSHCPATFDGERDDIVWRLRTRAQMLGADYAADFIVPVFDAQQPPGFSPHVEMLAEKFRVARAEGGALAMQDPHVDISTSAAGGKRFVFPARRNRRTAIFLAVFALAFTAACALILSAMPRFLLLIFGPMSLLAWYGAALFAFRNVELRVDRHGIERTWRLLLLSGRRRIEAGDVAKIAKKVTMESNGTPYYSVSALTRDGKKVFLVSHLATSDAAHVVAEIRTALGTAAE